MTSELCLWRPLVVDHLVVIIPAGGESVFHGPPL